MSVDSQEKSSAFDFVLVGKSQEVQATSLMNKSSSVNWDL